MVTAGLGLERAVLVMVPIPRLGGRSPSQLTKRLGVGRVWYPDGYPSRVYHMDCVGHIETGTQVQG